LTLVTAATDHLPMEEPLDESPATSPLTLASLLDLFHRDALDRTAIRLMRHSFQDDRAILNELGVDDETRARIGLRSAADKLAALRANPKLAEVFSAEQRTDKLASAGRRARLVLQFAGTSGGAAEFLGAWDVGADTISYAEYTRRYEPFLGQPPDFLQGAADARYVIHGLGLSGIHTAASNDTVFYDLTPRPDILPGMGGRLVVAWPNARAFVIARLEREVREIRARGFVKAFDGFERFSLSWDELHMITNNPEGNPDWFSRLSSVSGVYLVTDEKTGALYVGSATGKQGIWGRWVGYGNPTSWHNTNEGLRALFDRDPHHQHHFRFSVLAVMSRSVAERDVLAVESIWKDRLGSRTISLGYNRN
jgi:hypothetical protein